jgi:hypothetical protein
MRRIYGIPLLLAFVSAIGLLCALLGDGLFDILSWLALAAPLTVAALALMRKLDSPRDTR